MEIVKGSDRSKDLWVGDVVRAITNESEEYFMLVHYPSKCKYHLVDLKTGVVMVTSDCTGSIGSTLNRSFVDWEVVDTKLSVSK